MFVVVFGLGMLIFPSAASPPCNLSRFTFSFPGGGGDPPGDRTWVQSDDTWNESGPSVSHRFVIRGITSIGDASGQIAERSDGGLDVFVPSTCDNSALYYRVPPNGPWTPLANLQR